MSLIIQAARRTALGLALAATTVVSLAASPAEARDRWGRHRGGGDDAAIAAGIAGLAIGAAISDNGGRYYNDRSYRGGSYYPQYRDSHYYDSYPQYRGSYYYNSYPQYNGYYNNNYDRRYRDYDRYERKHGRWHNRHDRRGH